MVKFIRVLPPSPPPLYDELYRCMRCAAATLKDGVRSFVQPGHSQTIPVSHFGNIRDAEIWLIGMNPEGGGDFRKGLYSRICG